MRILTSVVVGAGALQAHPDVALATVDLENLQTRQPIATPKTSKFESSSGIANVIMLLKKMKVDTQADIDNDKAQYDRFACFCKEEGEARGVAIEEAKTLLKRLTNDIGVDDTGILTAKARMKAAETTIAKEMKNQKALTNMMARDDEEFQRKKTDAIETVNVLSKAIVALRKGKSKTFLQTGTEVERQTVDDALSLVQELTGKSVGEGGMGQVIGYVAELRRSTSVDMQSATTDNLKAKEVYVQAMKLSMQAVALAKSQLKAAEEKLAAAMKKKGEDVELYNATKEKMDVDVSFFDAMTADCDTRAKFYANNYEESVNEINAITQGIQVLDKLVADKKAAGFFVQMKMTTESQVDALSKKIYKMTPDNKQVVMALMATEVGSKTTTMAKIISKCESLIDELKGEITKTEENKQHCMDETHRLEMDVVKATGALEQQDVLLADLKSQLEYNQIALDDNAADEAANGKAQKHHKEECKNIKDTLKKQLELLEVDIAGIQDAIAKLAPVFGVDAVAALPEHEKHTAKYNDNYDTMEGGDVADQSTDFANAKKRRSGGVVVIELLKQIENSLTKNKVASAAEKASSEESCILEAADLIKEERAIKDAGIALNDEKTSLEGDQSTAKNERDARQTTKDAALQSQSDFGNCATRLDVYDNAIAAKKADIQGFIAVISTLESISKGTIASLA